MEIKLEKSAFAPGDAIRGEVTWNNSQTVMERIEVRLIWYTQGKGDGDFEIVDSVGVEMTSSSQRSGQEKFEFAAPNRPYSFSGKLISLVWAVEAIMYPGTRATRSDIVIGRNGKEILLDKSFDKPKKMLMMGR